MCTRNKRDTVPKTMPGVKGTLGNWMSLEDMDKAIEERFPGCMEGKNRTFFIKLEDTVQNNKRMNIVRVSNILLQESGQ